MPSKGKAKPNKAAKGKKVPEKENVDPEPAPPAPKLDLPTGDLSTLKVSEIKKHLADLGVNLGAGAYEKHELVTLLKRNMPAEAEPTETVEVEGDFLECEKFEGLKKGFDYKLGDKGFGYYRSADAPAPTTPPKPPTAAEEAASAEKV